MGQYHVTVNLDKREFIQPHGLGEGLKLLEQGWHPYGITRALHMLLAVSDNRGGGDYHGEQHGFAHIIGRWGGDRIAVVGDYTENGDFEYDIPPELVYNLCRSPERLAEIIAMWEEQYPDDEEMQSKAQILRAVEPFTDITVEVREAIAAIVASEDDIVWDGSGDFGYGNWVKAS